MRSSYTSMGVKLFENTGGIGRSTTSLIDYLQESRLCSSDLIFKYYRFGLRVNAPFKADQRSR